MGVEFAEANLAVGLQHFDAKLRQQMHVAVIELARQQGVIPATEAAAVAKGKLRKKI